MTLTGMWLYSLSSFAFSSNGLLVRWYARGLQTTRIRRLRSNLELAKSTASDFKTAGCVAALSGCIDSIGCTRPRAKKCAHMRLTAAGAKYLFCGDVSHAASFGRYGTEPSAGSVPSKYLALAVPTDLRLSVASGMEMTAPALISFSPFFL